MIAVAVPTMVAMMVPAAFVTTVTVVARFHVERICRAVVPPMMPAMVMVTVPMATLPMVVKAMPAYFTKNFVEDSRRQSTEDQLLLDALIMVPATLMLAFTAEHRLDADGEHCQSCNCSQY